MYNEILFYYRIYTSGVKQVQFELFYGLVPLAWALLSGVLLHPYKRSLTNKLRQALVRIQQNDMNAGITVAKSLYTSIGRMTFTYCFLSGFRHLPGRLNSVDKGCDDSGYGGP